jgi:hypothetical protein
MKPRTADEKQLVLARIIRDLKRLRADAKRVDCDFLGFMLAQSQDEAQAQLETLEGEAFPD